MNDRIRRHHERNGRVKQFHSDNTADFPAASIGHTHFTAVGTAYDDATALHADYQAAYGASGLDTEVKSVAREELRSAMSRIARTARSMNYDFPGIVDQFRVPRGANDADLLAAGRAFYAASANFDFASYGMPANFRTDLNDKCDAFQASIDSSGTAMDQRVAALAEISDKVMSEARISLARPCMVCSRLLLTSSLTSLVAAVEPIHTTSLIAAHGNASRNRRN